MNTSETLIERLAGSEMYRDYERAFREATGMPVALRPMETWQLPLHGQRKENPFCALMADRAAPAVGLQTQEKLAQAARHEPCAMICAYGLCELAVPVKLGTETIGYLQTGQVMRRKPTAAAFQRAVAKAKEFGVDLDNAQAKGAYFQTLVASPKKMDSVTSLLTIFADHLSMKSNQITVQTANAEPPVIARAKKYLEEHHPEDLSLGQGAAAVHTSIFYFCKLFRKVTGINFTGYVSRVRTEKAKNLLLHPNLRISEIAYEIGFQSLTHFNRVFKKVVGESPTEYRGHLPKAA